MDIFDFEELVAEMLSISDEQREDSTLIEQKFYETFDVGLEQGFELAKKLIEHTVSIPAGLSGTNYHAFISKKAPIMLMKVKA